ncbi:MAG: heme-binding protein [Pseudonocardiaceae bacterium]
MLSGASSVNYDASDMEKVMSSDFTVSDPTANFRVSESVAEVTRDLGPLGELPGTWMGSGFNLISRPDQHDKKPFFLQLNDTREILAFTDIGAPIPNRGSVQDDIHFLGVHYLQQVSDAMTNGALHIEPGLWLNLPATPAGPGTKPPAVPASVVRLATIPHGDAVLAQGAAPPLKPVPGGPKIPVADSTPVNLTGPNAGTSNFPDPHYLDPFKNTPPPPGIPADARKNPNLVLTDAIKGQNIIETVTLDVDTQTALGGLPGGISNIPFVVENANATRVQATFWIEKVQLPGNSGYFMQLQYSQKISLDFLDIGWPHISVGTLVKQ